ncbi:MAG: AAA family ATPase [Acidimicrobiales bacterium]
MGALDGRRVYEHALIAGYFYQAQLRAELIRRLGVEWDCGQRLCRRRRCRRRGDRRAFRRRAEILERLTSAASGRPGAGGHARHPPRQGLPPRPGRRHRAAEPRAERGDRVGFGPAQVAGLSTPASDEPSSLAQVGDIFRDLAGPDGLTKHKSTFTRPDVLRAFASALPDGADVAAIEDLASFYLFATEPVAVGDVHGAEAWTTQDLLDTERRVLAGIAARRHAGTGIADRAEVAAAIGARPTIGDEQADMVADLCLAGHGVDVVVGAAGTGKTFALDTARVAWERSGYRVHGAALSARAAAELQAGSGIESTTIARLLGQIDAGRTRLDTRAVVVVDEAGMVGTRTLDRLHQATSAAGAKLVLVGDPAQLPEIDAGGAFAALTERLDPIRLVDNRRQVHHWERGALDDLRSGRIAAAVATYQQRQRIVVVADPDELHTRVVQDWFASHQAGDQALMVAAHRAEVRDLNQRARQLLDDAGLLGPTRLRVGGHEFAEGDRVMAVGRNHYDLDILNGDLGTITGIGPNGDITFHADRTAEPRTMPAARIEAGFLDHGYARTNHKTQGATVDRTFILGDDGDLDRQAAYAALSRGRIENRLYVPDPDDDLLLDTPAASPIHEHVTYELSRDRSQRLATDHLDAQAGRADDLDAHLPHAHPDPEPTVDNDLW